MPSPSSSSSSASSSPSSFTLNYVPASLTVTALAGASIAFTLQCRNADGSPFDLAGYTVEAPFAPRLDTAPPVAGWTTATELTTSTVTLSLDAAQSAELGPVPIVPASPPPTPPAVPTTIAPPAQTVSQWVVWLAKDVAGVTTRTALSRGGLVLERA